MMSSDGPAMKWLPPSFQDLLLEEGTPYDAGGFTRTATGTGILTLLGSARAAKTSLAYAMIDTVIRTTNRPVSFVGFPDVVMEAMPAHWEGRIYNPPDIEKLLEFKRPAVVLLDDTAVTMNSRDSMTTSAKLMSRLAGVISHIGGGLTVILTTQSMSGIDLSLLRYTQLAVGIRRMSPITLWSERSQWAPKVVEAQQELSAVAKDQNWRDVYYSMMDEQVCVSWFPEWLDRSKYPERADKLSRPFRYMSSGKLKELVLRPPKTKRKKDVDE